MKSLFFVVLVLLRFAVSEVDIFEEIAQNNKNSVGNSDGLVINLRKNLLVDNKMVGKLNFVRDAKISGLGNKRKLEISIDVVNESSSVINTASSFLAIEHVDFSLSSVCSFPSLIYAMSSSFVNIDTVDFSPKQDERKGRENNGMLSPINAALFAVVDSMLTLSNSVISKLNFTGEGSAALVVTGKAQVVLNNTLFRNLGISSLAWSLISMGDNRASVRSSTLFSRSLSSLPSSPSSMRQRYLDNGFSCGGLIISGCKFTDITMDSSGTMANGVVLDIIIESLVNISDSVVSGINASISTASPVDFVLGVIRLVGNPLDGVVSIASSIIESIFAKGNVTGEASHSFGIILETVIGTFTNVSLTATSTAVESVSGERFFNILDPLKCSYDKNGTAVKPGSLGGEILKVKLHSGNIIKKQDLLFNGDAYVKLKCAGQEGRSKVKLNSLNPVWDEGFELSVKADATAEQKKLVLELWNMNVLLPDVKVGTGVVEDPMIYFDVVGEQGVKGENVSVLVELKKNESTIGTLIIYITIPEAEETAEAFITYSHNHRGVRLLKKTVACIDREWLLLAVSCAVNITKSIFNCTQAGGLLLQACNATLNGSLFDLVYEKVSDVVSFALPYSTFPSFSRFIECINGSIVDVIVEKIKTNFFFFASADSTLTINSSTSIISTFLPVLINLTSSVLGIGNETGIRTGTATQSNSLLETVMVTLVGESLFPCNLIYQIFHPNGTLVKLPGGEFLQSFVTGLTEKIVTFNFSAFEGWEEAEVRVAVKGTAGAESGKIRLGSGKTTDPSVDPAVNGSTDDNTSKGGEGGNNSGKGDNSGKGGNTSPKSSGMPGGAIVGITVGVIVGVAGVVAVAIIVVVLQRQKRNKIQDSRVIRESGNDAGSSRNWKSEDQSSHSSGSEEPRAGSYLSPTSSPQSQFLPKSSRGSKGSNNKKHGTGRGDVADGGNNTDRSIRSKHSVHGKKQKNGDSDSTNSSSVHTAHSDHGKKHKHGGNEEVSGKSSSKRKSKKSRASSSEAK